jgi:hypothetical protein
MLSTSAVLVAELYELTSIRPGFGVGTIALPWAHLDLGGSEVGHGTSCSSEGPKPADEQRPESGDDQR